MLKQKILLALVGVFLFSISTVLAEPPAPVPKTGQIYCWNSSGGDISCTGTGQDGEYQKGVAWPNPRFSNHRDGTITDNLTGLMWTQDAQEISGLMTWAAAIEYCENLVLGNSGCGIHSDWRLPNIKELQSLTSFGNNNPALPSSHPFSNVQTYQYWSSTTNLSFPDYAWYVHMSDGHLYYNYKSGELSYAWCVRGGPN